MFLRSEKGQSIVETAIALPIALMLIMAVINFSLIMNSRITVNDAARQAARELAITGNASQAQTTFVNELKAGGLDISSGNYSVIKAKVTGNDVEFQAVYHQKTMVPWLDQKIFGDENIEPLPGRISLNVTAVSKKE